jgi:hypothetical protein
MIVEGTEAPVECVDIATFVSTCDPFLQVARAMYHVTPLSVSHPENFARIEYIL